MESFWAPAKAVSEDILPHSVLLPATSDPQSSHTYVIHGLMLEYSPIPGARLTRLTWGECTKVGQKSQSGGKLEYRV